MVEFLLVRRPERVGGDRHEHNEEEQQSPRLNEFSQRLHGDHHTFALSLYFGSTPIDLIKDPTSRVSRAISALAAGFPLNCERLRLPLRLRAAQQFQ